MSLKKYFDILGLSEKATSLEIRKQFRALAMRYHPDKNTTPDAKEKFLQLTEAYEILIGKKNIRATNRDQPIVTNDDVGCKEFYAE